MTSRALLEAIDYASHERLKMTLKAICDKSAVARELVGHELMVDSRSSSEEPFHSTFPSVLPMAAVLGATSNGVAPSRKRPSIQFIECTRCNRKFETVAEHVGDCVYHDAICTRFPRVSSGAAAAAEVTHMAAAKDPIKPVRCPSKE
ncbi:hypothetical protein SLS57_011904 [Botryosphaeria dothidea]